jgi:UDP-N-acetylglucosamine transferase subunit ALG13
MAAILDELVVIQIGATPYLPRFAQHVDYVHEAQMHRLLSKASVVISHAGAGSILSALQVDKPLVLAPRMANLGEVIDDHQFELAATLSERGRAVMVTDLSAKSLAKAISKSTKLHSGVTGGTCLHVFLQSWIAEQAAQPPSRRWSLFVRGAKEED